MREDFNEDYDFDEDDDFINDSEEDFGLSSDDDWEEDDDEIIEEEPEYDPDEDDDWGDDEDEYDIAECEELTAEDINFGKSRTGHSKFAKISVYSIYADDEKRNSSYHNVFVFSKKALATLADKISRYIKVPKNAAVLTKDGNFTTKIVIKTNFGEEAEYTFTFDNKDDSYDFIDDIECMYDVRDVYHF